MSKVKIVNDDKIIKHVHEACREYFKALPDHKINTYFKIVFK